MRSKYEPEDLFRDRPSVQRTMNLADMESAIAAAADRRGSPLEQSGQSGIRS
jgi:hypothetical protein